MDDAEMDAFVANISDTVSGRAAKTVIVALSAALAESQAWAEKLSGMKFSDRMHAALLSRAESAEQERDRLRNGGCARDQRLTQHCTYAQAAEQAKQIAERDAGTMVDLAVALERKIALETIAEVDTLADDFDNAVGLAMSSACEEIQVRLGEKWKSLPAIDSAISAQLSGEER